MTALISPSLSDINAIDEPELSPRELAARFTDTRNYFVSEASVYRLLKAYDLITSPAFIVIKAADEFRDPRCTPHSRCLVLPTWMELLWLVPSRRYASALSRQYPGVRLRKTPRSRHDFTSPKLV